MVEPFAWGRVLCAERTWVRIAVVLVQEPFLLNLLKTVHCLDGPKRSSHQVFHMTIGCYDGALDTGLTTSSVLGGLVSSAGLAAAFCCAMDAMCLKNLWFKT